MARRPKTAAAPAAATQSEAPSPATAGSEGAGAEGAVAPSAGEAALDLQSGAASNDTASAVEGGPAAPPAEAPVSAGVIGAGDAILGDDQIMAVITARSRSRKTFRRCGIAWGAEFETVRVPLADAVRIAEEPALEVKPLAADD